ncbi:MAG: trimethylamine methyltransferase family protein [Desulfatirhabdiaceae bacterium]
MHIGLKSQCVPTYRLLTEDQINHLHSATLELLESVGVRVLYPDAVDMLAGAGCRVMPDNIVRIPGSLVEACIKTAPSGITIYNRLGDEAMRLEGRRTVFGMGTDLTHTIDLESGCIRQSRIGDVANAAKVGDALEDIDFIASYALPYDSPVNLMYIDSFMTELENSVKPIFYTAAGIEDIQVIHEMAAAVMGGKDALRNKPIHIHYAEPLSPLTHSTGAIQKLFFCADNGVPVNYTPGMMSGASAPVTLAGAIAVGNAEALSGIVLHQLRAKGAPIISGFGMSTFDMKTLACVYGCPEYRLALSACADLFHYYGIPMWGTAGVSDAHCIDQQAGMEWAISLMTAVLDGANLVHDVGYLGQGMVGHPAALVMCAEIIGYVRRMARGFTIDADHLAMDVIRDRGPGGDFLSTDHTFDFFRKEHWQPHLCNRQTLDNWMGQGEKTWAGKAIEKTRDILTNHRPVPLGSDVRSSLNALRQQAEIDLKHTRFDA